LIVGPLQRATGTLNSEVATENLGTMDQAVTERASTGLAALDERLGGGLLRGALTVLVGATGIGKSQLALQFAAAGRAQEGRAGILFDVSCRGDSQSHAEYAARMFDWRLAGADPVALADLERVFADEAWGEYLHVFDYRGRQSVRREWEYDAWQQWRAELVGKLNLAIAFFYGHFVRGVRRCVIDGVDPAETPGDSVQMELFEYVYQQILSKSHDWVARDLFRQRFREFESRVAQHPYERQQIAALLSYTSHESMLDDLISKPLADGDWLAQANTVIYLGKIREGRRMERGLYIAKHRGSACSEEIIRYEIAERGLRLLD
jgi:KaiC/GvpD/RAD55 family RecA-like ATPase